MDGLKPTRPTRRYQSGSSRSTQGVTAPSDPARQKFLIKGVGKAAVFASGVKQGVKKHAKKNAKRAKQASLVVRQDGVLVWKPPRFISAFVLFCKRHRILTRIAVVTMIFVVLLSLSYSMFQEYFRAIEYKISPKAAALLSDTNASLGDKLTYDGKQQTYTYNKDYTPSKNDEVTGQTAGPKFSAQFRENPQDGLDITDPNYGVSFTLKPKFGLQNPIKDKNRLVYPLTGKQGAKVISLQSIGYKEDIVLEKSYGNIMEFSYELKLPESLEARLDRDGSIGIYGPELTALMGNVSAGTDKDAATLAKARQNAKKTKLVFRMPTPFIKQSNDKIVKNTAHFTLQNNILTLRAEKLADLKYPISIDPTVYIETAAKLMRGNNETNTDFDVDNELIQKSQTTGARIDAWQGNLDMSTATWDIGAAAAGGYIYRAGGRTGAAARPQIVDQQESLSGNSNTTSFVMSMPATRPAGDLYLAMLCHDGSNGSGSPGGTSGNTISTPSGWTKYADVQGFAAYYKVGADQGGGNEASSYTFTGNNEQWGGVIVRVSGADTSSPISGTPGVGFSTSNAVPTFPATTPAADNTLIIRAVGADNDHPSNSAAWVPSAHTRIASNSSNTSGSGTNDCGYAAATMDNSPASGVSTGTVSLADSSVNDDYGAATIAIKPVASTVATQTSVNWAKFNSSSLAIESPNPGTGACSGWCSDSAYDLPSARRGHTMIAYNGYLYVLGGLDGSGTRASTVYIAKLGANGEPQLWHPTDTNKNNWVYWYTGTGAALNGSTAKSYFGAVAANNRMYILGGETNASPNGITTVEKADILPNGTLASWTTTGMQALPAGAGTHMQGVQFYNNTIYTIGGFEGARTSSSNLRSAVYFSHINSDGTMNSWQSANSITTARASFGGSMSYIWGAYIYIGGGCSAVNASGYCTTMASDVQIASLNADGSLDTWSSMGSLDNSRIGYSLIGWQGGLYRLGGCTSQNTTSGECTSTLADVDYGVINEAGEVSTVNITETSGTAPCSGGTPKNCDLPPTGDSAGQGGQMLNASAILNGYLYVIGGCTNFACSQSSGNVSYVSIGSDGSLQAPSTCGGTSYGAWCVDSTNRVNGTSGVSAAGVTTFNNRIYIVGGIDETATGTQNIYYNSTNTNGSLSGAWGSTSFATAGLTAYTELAYTYVFSRANPASAGSNPGNLYVLGGCGDISASAGCGTSNYRQEVYKCNIATAGSVNGCTRTGQLQIDSTPGYGNSTDGLGIHSGTVYAGYIFLVGGYSQFEADKDDVLYAKIDDSNNIVAANGGSDWIESPNKLSTGRRRGWAFGYNGHIYAVGGYDDSGVGIIPFIEWSKMNVSDGSIDPFVTSSVEINQRWGLSMSVSNSYAYVIGGCDVGISPGGCSSFEPSVQTFQLYNNDSGSVANFTAQSDQTFSTDTDRWGASSTIYTDTATEQSYIYVAGGCKSATDCTDATNSTQYATISAADGSIGTWTAGGNLPADRAWGSLEVAGTGTSQSLYYIGGQDDTATNEQSTVYYTTGISSGNPTWGTATNGLPAARTKFGSAVWNNRLYVVGGLDGSAAVSNVVYVSPQLNSGGNITSAWSSTSSFTVARTGAAVTAYANNLYLIGGYDGSNYLSDVQFTQINSDGTLDSWSNTRSLAGPLRDGRAVSANGYIYVVGGRSAASTCNPKVVIAPISANTTIVSGNNPTGVGEWYETNVRYTGDRYGAAVSYSNGKLYTMGGGCTAPLSSNRHYYSSINSQPQVATYSRLIDTDTDVFPNSWLLNGIDNSIGARWNVRYRSMNDTDGVATDCGTADMTTWGQDTNFGEVTLGNVETYTPKDGSGTNINCARYFYFYISIDASKTFGYPENVDRGPTINDVSLFFTSDPSKRLRHGKTFTGGEQQPLDTPCRKGSAVAGDPNYNCPLP